MAPGVYISGICRVCRRGTVGARLSVFAILLLCTAQDP